MPHSLEILRCCGVCACGLARWRVKTKGARETKTKKTGSKRAGFRCLALTLFFFLFSRATHGPALYPSPAPRAPPAHLAAPCSSSTGALGACAACVRERGHPPASARAGERASRERRAPGECGCLLPWRPCPLLLSPPPPPPAPPTPTTQDLLGPQQPGPVQQERQDPVPGE